MMKIKISVLSIAMLIIGQVYGQDQLVTLQQCRDSAKVNWPNFMKSQYFEEEIELVNKQLNKNYLPKINLSANASYQSEVVTVEQVPGMPSVIPELPLDNYNAELSLNQVLYDGGATTGMKKVQNDLTQLNIIAEEINNYELMQQINNLYLNILLLEENNEILQRSLQVLDSNLVSLKASVNNGMILESELNKVIAEKLKLEKKIIDTENTLQKFIASLNTISGLSIDENSKLELPFADNMDLGDNPMLKSFDQQVRLTQSSLELESRTKFPQLMLYAKGGYGRPGFDFFNTDLHPYGIVGVKLSWNVLDWGEYSTKKQKTEVQKLTIEANKENYILKNKIEIEKCESDIKSLLMQIEKDDEIIALKEHIMQASQSKLINGSITSNEYLKDFNELQSAKQVREIAKIKIAQLRILKQHLQGVTY